MVSCYEIVLLPYFLGNYRTDSFWFERSIGTLGIINGAIYIVSLSLIDKYVIGSYVSSIWKKQNGIWVRNDTNWFDCKVINNERLTIHIMISIQQIQKNIFQFVQCYVFLFWWNSFSYMVILLNISFCWWHLMSYLQIANLNDDKQVSKHWIHLQSWHFSTKVLS